MENRKVKKKGENGENVKSGEIVYNTNNNTNKYNKNYFLLMTYC